MNNVEVEAQRVETHLKVLYASAAAAMLSALKMNPKRRRVSANPGYAGA